MLTRRVSSIIGDDLDKKMVILSGPRQTGKTTLCRHLNIGRPHYYNWDIASHRKELQNHQLDATADLWIFDELHKFKKWKNWLKGVFDEHHAEKRILVTGSAHLKYFSKGGDSLQGRYFSHYLHPLTVSEILQLPWQENLITSGNIPAFQTQAQEVLDQLLRLGGFPEPFTSGSDDDAAKWRLEYGTNLVRGDVRDLEHVMDLDRMELMHDRLTDMVGSVFSLNSLREDLGIAYGTAKKWLSIFEKLYSVFTITPYGPPRIKAVKKEPKLYCWDWARVPNEAARLENLVAVHLYRLCDWLQETKGCRMELRYFRTVHDQEVDFILLRDRKPWLAVEVKSKEQELDPSLKYLLERLHVPHCFQVHGRGTRSWVNTSIPGRRVSILPVASFLQLLP